MATPLPARRNIATTVLLLAAIVAAFLTGVVSSPTAEAAAPGFCSLSGMQKNTWTGGAGDGLWDTGGNWSLGRAPNFTDGATGYVCINARSTVTMRAGESAELQAFDVAAGTTLKLDTGSILLVEGSQVTRPSYLRSGTTTLLKGTLGGPGRIELLGAMTWSSSPTGASTMSTRRCGLGATCSGAVSGPRGLLVVGNGGRIDVTPLGVNLADEYQLRVYGTLKLLGQGYVSADRGTSLELLPKLNATGVGTLLITNDGGWYEGRTLYGITTLSTIANGGLIRKSAGTGTSVIVGTYTRVGGGAIRVDRGTLSMPDGVAHNAIVGASDTYGFGACNTDTFGCQPVADAQDPQTGSISVPSTDGNGASIELLLDGAGPAGTIGERVYAGASGLQATPTNPAVLQLRYDTSVLGGKIWSQINVDRAPGLTTTFVAVPACQANGTPPSGSLACVDRRGQATSSRTLSDGDALMVIRTTGFSRWRAR